MKNVLMMDIETSGNKPGCKVLSIGAFGFTSNGQQTQFYCKFDIIPQVEAHLFDDEDTMQWWRKQDPATMQEAFSGKINPKEGIKNFIDWVYANFTTTGKDFQAWSCGIDFDFPIFSEFMRRFGFNLPIWPFYKQYDYRTIKNLVPSCKLHEINPAKHTALEDAKAQMRGLRHFYKTRIEQI